MRLQSSQSNCGPSALSNALAALGIARSVDELEKACGTSATNGTPARGILKAATKIEGCRPVMIREKRRDVGLLKLEMALRQGRPVLLVWDDGSHWVSAIGVLGSRFLVADSADSELVISMEVDALAEKWVDEGVYEGLVL